MMSFTVVSCVHSNIEYHDEFFKNIIEKIAPKVMANFGFGHRFHDLIYFEFGIHFSYSLNSL